MYKKTKQEHKWGKTKHKPNDTETTYINEITPTIIF
jgi:hypothetical protein